MKNKLISFLLTGIVLCSVALPVLAENVQNNPDAVSIIESEAEAYLEEIYTVPIDTDLALLQKEKIEQDGVTYLYDSMTSENVAGEVTEMNVRQMVYVRSENGDLATVQAAQPKSIPYKKDGFAGTLFLDMTATETNGIPIQDAAWQNNDQDEVFSAVWVSEPGSTTSGSKGKREYEYRFWYVGTVKHTEPDMLRVTVRYLAHATAEPEKQTLSFPDFSLPTFAMPEWLKDAHPMFLPVTGAVLLAGFFLMVLAMKMWRHRESDPDHAEGQGMTTCEVDPDTRKRKKKYRKAARGDKDGSAEEKVTDARAPMPVPDFLKNMDRGGTDTLNEDGGMQNGQRV